MKYREWDHNYSKNYISSNFIVRYFFNMRLKGALEITLRFEKRKLSTLSALEVGCHDGRFSLMLSNYFRIVIGTDLNPYHFFCNIVNTPPNINNSFCAANIINLPFKDSTFDVVYGLGVFEHFPNGNMPYKEIYRVLKPNGKIIAGFPVEIGISLLIKKMVLDLIGRSRITMNDIYRCFSFGHNHGPKWSQDHRDYNWKRSIAQISEEKMQVLTKKYLPISWLGSFGNPFILIVAEKKE